jgi:two-component system cell cycle sensor histidine kinase/response regulator CckA
VNNELEDLRRKVAELDGYKTRCEQLERALKQSSAYVDVAEHRKEAEALRESEAKYRRLVENSLQGLSIVQNGRIVFCNKAIAEMSGYSIEELLSLEDSIALVHEDDRPKTHKRRQDRLMGIPVSSHYEHRLIRKDGESRWMEVFASLTEYNGGPATQIVSMDITERKQVEESLRESEERFRLITETIDEVFWIFDTEKPRTTYLSPAFDRIWGFSRKELMGNPAPDLKWVHQDDRELVRSSFQQVRTGRLMNYEYRIFRPDGSIRFIWHRGYPVRDDTGKIKQYVGVGQDITAFKNAQEELQESREYYNQIINRISDPIFVKDRNHRFVLVNDAMCTFIGKRREEVLGETLLEFIPDKPASLWNQEEEVFNTGHENLSEDFLRDAHNNLRHVMTKKSLFIDKSGDKQIIGILRDITEYKQLEAQLLQAQKMEAIGVLAGGVAHDFNNLLTVVKGYSEILKESFDPDDARRLDIEQIATAGQHAAALTTQLLAFSRKQILQPKILNLNNVLVETNNMLRRLIGEDIKLVTSVEPDLGLVKADPVQVQQIIMNLVVNARDAMPNGGILTIETANFDIDGNYIKHHPHAIAGSYVMLAISDNGIGMDAVTKDHIFEPFYTTKAKGKGTGLGLSTVYGIVKQSDGFIWAYSELGKGTTFKIYLPRVEGSIAPDVTSSKLTTNIHCTETLLVVEDETSVRALASRILRDRGYTVLEASNGSEALDIAQKHTGELHMVITDVVMPEMGGKALSAQLKAMRSNIKTLYVSGYPDNAIAHQGILDSDVAFLQKPFTVENLVRKVREVLDSSTIPPFGS